ncbi:hypothetical protein KDL01_07850 [Actinospica durhamensis]|uniref:Secreted protein n=1 Tax=Actinospica durhamensis TaxID=1508375 RepID=A0A941IQQ4_9ACTN|nr:hypothetical protein [Actinospica durhamensis]MBR7833173.1 hypothetical protein [Actinospica durhamensis]
MRILRVCCAAVAAAALSMGAASAASAATAPAATAASAAHAVSAPVHAHPAEGTAATTTTTVLDLTKASGSWSRTYTVGTDAATGAAVIHPDTGTGCHSWDLGLFDVCIEVFGSGLNVTEVQGWADTLDAGWVIVYDTDDTLNGLIPAAIDFVDYKFGSGGRNFPNDDSMCAHSDYAGQTACLLIHT